MPNPHLPGSIPLSSAEEVFTWAGQTLGDRLRRVPDGETGEQRKFWQAYLPWFADNLTLERGPDIPWGPTAMIPQYRVKPGVTPVFEPFEFGPWARESYEVFKRLRSAGVLSPTTRIQVTLPHSVDAVWGATEPASTDAVYEAYSAQTKASVEEIADSIPREDLAIQFDCPSVTCAWIGEEMEGWINDKEYLLREHIGHGEWVPEGVELGFHLCFGDSIEEENVGETRADDELASDASGLMELSNALVRGIDRPVTFLHHATYAHWLEPERFEPLQGLEIDGTELSIGVINLRRDVGLETGIEHTRRRTAAAREALGPVFGVASSCGMGRYTPEQFAAATELYREFDQA
jgi:hypothetical protein